MKDAAAELATPNSTEQIIREIASLLPQRETSLAA
jgi:hypothetical protein